MRRLYTDSAGSATAILDVLRELAAYCSTGSLNHDGDLRRGEVLGHCHYGPSQVPNHPIKRMLI